MARIEPFAGIRYNQEVIPDLALVTTPPYDVIDEAAQDRYYQRHPYNIIRLELGRILPGDDHRDNRYRRAASFFHDWLGEGILQREKQPSLYLYEQEFSLGRKRRVRTGFFCNVQLSEYSQGEILPHEETLPKAKEDRLQLLRACHANFSPIFGLYADETGLINQLMQAGKGNRSAHITLVDEAGEEHRLWIIDNPRIIEQVRELMLPRTIFIADGHHRYETALAFHREAKEQGLEGFGRVMMVLVNLYDPGLAILPTHRMVRGIAGLEVDRFLRRLAADFEVEPLTLSPADGREGEELTQLLARRGQGQHAFGLYAGGQQAYLLTLRPGVTLERVGPGRSRAWCQLDVSVLHSLVLEAHLGIGSQEREGEAHLTYTRDPHFAVRSVKQGDHQMAFLLNPTRVEEVTAVAAAGDKMPQKSTYFYPKLLTGLVINHLEGALTLARIETDPGQPR